ncbi:hypothetical protein BST61_g10898 [Cercospora zeina]
MLARPASLQRRRFREEGKAWQAVAANCEYVGAQIVRDEMADRRHQRRHGTDGEEELQETWHETADARARSRDAHHAAAPCAYGDEM